MKFADKLISLRSEKHLTQSEVAAAAGISRRNYISYETEGRYPRKREIYHRLARLFDCDVNYLLTEDEKFINRAEEQYGETGKKEAEQLVDRLVEIFSQGELSDEEKDTFMKALTEAYFECKTRKDEKNNDPV